MPAPTTMRNTFTNMRTSFPNQGIWAIVNDYLQFRVQMMLRGANPSPEQPQAQGEFAAQSGWNDALNGYIKRELERLAMTVKRVTYSASGDNPDAVRAVRLAEAKDTSRTLANAFDGKSINADDLVMPASSRAFSLSVDLTGVHPDYPQPTPQIIKNEWARNLIILLDDFAVKATNLDSASQPSTINAPESAQLLSMLNAAFAICELKGGDENKSDIPTGLLASERPSTFNADGAHDVALTPPAAG